LDGTLLNNGTSPSSFVVRLKGPFDLPLSLAASASFLPPTAPASTVLRVAATIGGRPAIIKVCQISKIPAAIEASSTMPLDERPLSETAQWLVSADLDLGPFYRIVEPHPIMGPIAKALRGLKPLRPMTLFEMAIIAITEQQLSLAAAFHIRTRLIERFGTPVCAYWVFPTPAQLAEASLQDLLACGLSRRKAEYVRGIAARAAKGAFDLDALKRKSDADVRACLMSNRGSATGLLNIFSNAAWGGPTAWHPTTLACAAWLENTWRAVDASPRKNSSRRSRPSHHSGALRPIIWRCMRVIVTIREASPL
jgi:hypothetical protein